MADLTSDFQTHTNVNWVNQHVGVVEYGGGDKGQIAMFYNRPVHNPSKSTEAGRPVYEDVIYVRIHPPGERLNIIDRPAMRSDAQRWPMQWAQFQQNKQQTPEGTPIDLFYPEQPSVAATLRASGVHTIEQCAALSASAMDNIGMGAQKWVNDAQKILEASSKGVAASTMRRELDERDGKIRTLTQQVELLKAEVNRLSSVHQTSGPTLESIQQQLAQLQGGGRPVIPAKPGRSFDSQEAMINATSPTAEEARRRRPSRRKAVAEG